MGPGETNVLKGRAPRERSVVAGKGEGHEDATACQRGRTDEWNKWNLGNVWTRNRSGR